MAAWRDDLQFYVFHFMPYARLPPGKRTNELALGGLSQ